MKYRSKYIFLVFIFLLFLPFGSCIEQVAPALSESDSQSLLVVEGQITNEEGPFRVKLSYSVPVNVNYYLEPELKADVRIDDDKGNSFQLKGDDAGMYETADKKLKGVPGNTYTLSITTADGVQYESTSELMQEVPDIDSVYFEEVKKDRIEQSQVYADNWLNIMVDSHDSTGTNKYWRFQFEETWQVAMLTNHVPVLHDAADASNFTFEKISIDEAKRNCWVTQPSSAIILATTVSNQNDALKGFTVQSIGPGNSRLLIGYSILVKQYSLSYDQYNFWKNLNDSNENTGGIYGTAPAPIYGNITCCDGKTKALGYFSVSCLKEKRLFIRPYEHDMETVSAYAGCGYFDYSVPDWIPKSYFGTIAGTNNKVYSHADFCADCRTSGTNVKPDYWQ